MPFFSRREPEEEVVQEPVQEEPRKRGLFGSHRNSSPTPTASTNSTRHSASTHHTDTGSSGVLRRSTDASGRSSGGGLLSKFGRHGEEMDPSIVQARERLTSAEAAEKEADKALVIARREVREAREEAKRLEIEAKEDARRAKVKSFHAKEVSKRGKALGRHGD